MSLGPRRKRSVLIFVLLSGLLLGTYYFRSQPEPKIVRHIQEAPAAFRDTRVTSQDIPDAPETGGTGNSAAEPPTTTATAPAAPPAHPSDELIKTATLVAESWSRPDAAGNRRRIAVIHNDRFKYPRLRVAEEWSGKTGQMVSRVVMVADHVVVAPRPDLAPEAPKARLERAGFKVREQQPGRFLLASFETAVDDPEELPRRIEELAASGDFVDFAEPDYLVFPCLEPNDPAYLENRLWGLHNRGGVNGYTADADIDAPEAWNIRNDAADVIVAVTDTGIRHDHSELAPNMWINPNEVAGDGTDNDGNGLIDDVFGYDAVNGDGDPMDNQGHGTHCAGTIGARGGNGIGTTGVAWNVKLMAGRFLGPFGGTTSDGIKVIDYARQKGAHIINASWGGGGRSLALQRAISDCALAGIPFVAAAGNSRTNNDSLPHYPSSYELPNIIAVAATDATDRLTSFSCYGRNSVDIAAPGWQIWSTYRGSTTDYCYLQGTSMAAPHVTGALALARAQFPTDTTDELIDRLYRSADVLPSLEGKVSSGGRLNLYHLLSGTFPYRPNDQFDQAQVLLGDHAAWSGGNLKATREADESTYSPAGEARTLWFAWQAPYDGFVTVTTRSLGMGQRIVAFQGESRNSLEVLADSGATAPAGGAETTVRFYAEAGAQYRIVTASGSEAGEMFSLTLELTAANDLLSQAQVLDGESFEYQGSNRGATAQPFETAKPHAGVGAGHSVWFRWTAPFSDLVQLVTEGSGTDTVLAVYSGAPQVADELLEIAANDDASAQERWSRVEFPAIENTTYYIAVDTAMGGTPGTFFLQGGRPGTPVIFNEPADIEVAIGARAVFSVGALGSPTLRYQWFRDGTPLPGAWENRLVIDPVATSSLGNYHVTVRNAYGVATSHSARLSEKPHAPTIVWQSSDRSEVAGNPVELSVQVRGSAPLTYSWRLNGELIAAANGPKLTINAITAAHAGTYECRVSNALGEASATMIVTMVDSPFTSWEWRLDSMPGPGVTDIKVIDGKCYAVTGDRIMVSTDGIAWKAWPLPPGIDGKAITKSGNTWLCTGTSPAGSGRSAISNDGVSWTVHTPTGLPGTDGSSTSGLHHVIHLQAFNGRFIGQTARQGNVFGTVVTSSNGIAWSNATLEGTTTSFAVSGPFAIGSGLILGGDGVSGAINTPARAFRSTDGVSWVRFNLPPGSSYSYYSSRGASRWNNQFVLFGPASGNYGWTSPNGIDWTLQTGKSWPGGVDLNGQFVSLGGAQFDGLSVAWGGDPWTAVNSFVKPATGDIIATYASFNDRVVYGTQRGFLGHLTGPGDLKSLGGPVFVPTQMVFADNQFFAIKNSTSGTRNGTPLVSGDGISWRTMRPWTWDSENPVTAFPLIGFTGNTFWGENSNTSATSAAKGLLPHVMPETPVANGLPTSVQSIASDGTTLLAIADAELYRSTNGGMTWQVVSGTPEIGGSYNLKAQVMRAGSHWLLTNSAPIYSYETGFVHFSSDGLTWTKTTGKPGFITSFNGKLYGLEANLGSISGQVKGWESTNNGLTWSPVAFHATDKLANLEIRQLGTFANALVALGYSSSENRTSLYFSYDGISWFRANTPTGLSGFATGLGQFVGYTSTGAIVQAGSPPPGGAAPVVKANYPLHLSAAMSGSWVDIAGEAFDPEGGAVNVQCQVDGVVVGTSGAGEFRFRFRALDPAGHTVVLRATDEAGLVGSDELRVMATPSQGINLIDSAEGRDYLPNVALVEFNGSFYAAGDYGIQRSQDGLTWEPLLLPSLSEKLVGLASGNGSLVAQAGGGLLYTTRDGVNWVQIGPSSEADYYVDQPITFTGGHFLVVQRVMGQIASNYRTSRDGIRWQSSSIYTEANQATMGENGVLVSLHRNFQTGSHNAVWSADGGLNWNVIPGVVEITPQAITHQFCHANGVFVIIASDGRSWRSTDGKSWTAGTLPTPPTNGSSLCHAGGRFFAGSSTHFLFTSVDGSSWQLLDAPVRADTVVHGFGRYVARGNAGMVWSNDGVKWKDAQGGPTLAIGKRLAADEDRFLVIDANGAAWSSTNGVVWRQDFSGAVADARTSLQLGQQMATLGGKILLGGTFGMLSSSADNGTSWQAATVNGQPVSTEWHFNRVQSAGGVAIATAAIGTSVHFPTEEKAVVRSVDGQNWEPVTALSSLRIVDVASNGSGKWLAVGSQGTLRVSSDHGATWQVTSGPALATARALAWFKGEWLLYGAVTSGGASRTWSSTNGSTWTDRGVNGLAYSNNDFFRVEAHGRLVVWNRTDVPVATTDGRTWQKFQNYDPWTSNSQYWVAPSVSGFTLAVPFSSSYPRRLIFRGSPDGQSWTEIPRPQHDTLWGTSIDNRLFLFSPGRIVEWPDSDLEIELQPASPATMGVGDFLECPVALRNLGLESIGIPLEADGWLSSDGFFGDGNDVYLGRIKLDAPAPPPGSEVTSTLRFELPGNIRPGNSRLIAVLDPAKKIRERNRSNNVSISSSAVVTIPQRQLTVVTNGNGTVTSDQVAEFYPQGARIAFVALPGKGARFAGWGGDAIGGFSETMIVLDADKTVLANFISTAALTVHTRGGGTVVQSSEDGIYTLGGTATLQAVPSPGWVFAGWKGHLTSSTPSASLTMNANKVVTANFTLSRESWTGQEFSAAELLNPAISGADSDPDGDGLANWREWLRGSNPKNPADRGQGPLRREGRWLVFTYTRMETLPTGHRVECQASGDLAEWTLPIEERIIGSSNGIETIEVRRDTGNQQRMFFRIEDTRPASAGPSQ